MEEWIGKAWDRLIRSRSHRGFPDAAVSLASMERTIAVFFRAMGGEAGLRVAPAAPQRVSVRRRLVERVAGVGERAVLPALDAQALRLPPTLDVFPEAGLNRDLYLWLAALAAQTADPLPATEGTDDLDRWLLANQQGTLQVLRRWPGLEARYRRLVDATLALRTHPDQLPPGPAAQERTLRAALQQPGSMTEWPREGQGATIDINPLWLYAPPSVGAAAARSSHPPEPPESSAQRDESKPAARAVERAQTPVNRNPFVLPFRAESLLSWADFIRVNRPTEEDDPADSRRIADSVDRLALAQADGQRVAARVRFDLDLPSPAADDLPLGPGHHLPEWDYRQRVLLPDWCRVQPMVARDSVPGPLPARLRPTARRLRSQLASLAPARRWQNAEQDGTEPDIDACVRAAADRALGLPDVTRGLYRAQTRRDRELSCLLLADLSLSTDAWVSDAQRVIDVIRDSLMVFGEALAATGDPFAMYGFSSLKRSLVRFHDIKHFDEPLGADVRGRIAALRPGYYTRLGAALRESTRRLAQRRAAQRILLLLSDGKPHDIDNYDGRHGVEDTRAAVLEARRAGVRPFCVTIDRDGAGYLPHVFGRDGYTVVRRPAELPARLPMLYAQLSR